MKKIYGLVLASNQQSKKSYVDGKVRNIQISIHLKMIFQQCVKFEKITDFYKYIHKVSFSLPPILYPSLFKIQLICIMFYIVT